MTSDLATTRRHLSQQLTDAIATDPLAALPVITAIRAETDRHLRDAVRQAALSCSWREIATALGVSKQAAHQRFKAYANGVTADMTTHHRAMRQARRDGNVGAAARSQARRDELAAQLRTAARALKEQT